MKKKKDHRLPKSCCYLCQQVQTVHMIPVIPIPIAIDPTMMYHKLQSETNSEKKGWVSKDSANAAV